MKWIVTLEVTDNPDKTDSRIKHYQQNEIFDVIEDKLRDLPHGLDVQIMGVRKEKPNEKRQFNGRNETS